MTSWLAYCAGDLRGTVRFDRTTTSTSALLIHSKVNNPESPLFSDAIVQGPTPVTVDSWHRLALMVHCKRAYGDLCPR